MNLEKYLSITGLPGLYTMVSSKPNGLLVKDLNDGKTKFCSLRKYQFTPLETVGIYTMTDTENLRVIFTSMKGKRDIMPDPKASKEELLTYFGEILPSFDKDKVYPNHITKIIRWFLELEEKGFLEEEEVEEKEEKKSSKPKAKKAPAKKAPARKIAANKAAAKRGPAKKTSTKSK